MHVLTQILGNWPIEHLIPYLDIFRMFLLHPRSQDIFRKIGGGIQEYTRFLDILNKGNDTVKTLVLRVFNNLFIHDSNRLFVIDKRQEILDNASSYVDSGNKNIRSAVAALLFK